MTQADCVHSTPPENTSPLSPNNPPPPPGSPAVDGPAGIDPTLVEERTGDQPPAQETGLYYPTDVEPETLFQAIGRLRKQARDEIERLLTFLDAIEDPELEDDDAEDGLDAEDGADNEPSLAALENHPSMMSWAGVGGQEHWAAGGFNDAEGDEHDGRELDSEDEGAGAEAELEPSLGWTEDEAATGRINGSRGSGYDIEVGSPGRPPQGGTTYVGPNVEIGRTYIGGLQISGLTDEQKRRLTKAMRYR